MNEYSPRVTDRNRLSASVLEHRSFLVTRNVPNSFGETVTTRIHVLPAQAPSPDPTANAQDTKQ